MELECYKRFQKDLISYSLKFIVVHTVSVFVISIFETTKSQEYLHIDCMPIIVCHVAELALFIAAFFVGLKWAKFRFLIGYLFILAEWIAAIVAYSFNSGYEPQPRYL
jgi:hypothetical protein